MDKKNNFKQKIALSLVISIMLIFGMIFFVIIPSVETIKESKINIEKIRVDLEKKYQEGKSLRKISENLKTIESELPELDKLFIKKSAAISFITRLEEISNKSNVEGKINLTDNKSTKDYQENNLYLSTRGSFINQINYLKELEKMNYYINVESLEITRTKDLVNMQIYANTYWTND